MNLSLSARSSASVRRLGRSSVARDMLQLAALLVPVCTLPAGLAFGVWSERQALAAEWTVEGPPCPIVTQLSPSVVGRKPPKVFRYGDAEFSRAFGAAYCAAIPESRLWTRESYRVCQFNNPGAVTVVAGDHRVIFQPPVGRRVTVTVRHGAASCVVGGWFIY